MKFKDSASIQDAVEQMRLANVPCAENRARINALMNGNPPWSEEERQANRIFTNYNSLEGPRIMHQARQQLDNAILSPGRFFKVSLDTGPQWARGTWSAILTEKLNKCLKRYPEWIDLIKSLNAQTVLHGIGPCYWPERYNPIPVEVGVEDVLVPAKTLVSMKNLEFFAIYREWTWPELYDMTHGKQVDPGWNMTLVDRLLKELSKQSLQTPFNGNRWLMPEKLEEDFKENNGLLYSAAPALYAWDFYYRDKDADDGEKWQRRVILDYQQLQPEGLRAAITGDSDSKNSFLYDSSKRQGQAGDSWREIIHWQFGNISNVAPFRYYSVRSLGYLLYAVCQVQNRLRCRFTDSIFESLLQYFWNVSEDDRERVEKIDLLHMGIIPQGLSFVRKEERHEVNEQLALMGLQQNRQLMDESSASYQPDSSSSRQGLTPETATAEIIRMNVSVALTSAMLNQSYLSLGGLYREVCRRFCIPESKHPLRVKLITELVLAGIPPNAIAGILNVETWDIEAEKVLGGGNKAMEAAQADRLMAVRAILDPQSQRLVTHKFVLANSDAQTANELVPLQGPGPSETAHFANLAIGTLMQGLPVALPRSTNLIEYVSVILTLLQQVVQQIAGLTEVPGSEVALADKLVGFFNTVNHLQAPIQALYQDEGAQEQAKAFEEALQAMIMEVQPIAQELQQKAQEMQAQGDNLPPEVQAKIQTMIATAKASNQIKDTTARLKLEHKDAAFHAEIERRDAKAAMDLQEQAVRTAADIESMDLKTRAEILVDARKATSKPAEQKPD